MIANTHQNQSTDNIVAVLSNLGADSSETSGRRCACRSLVDLNHFGSAEIRLVCASTDTTPGGAPQVGQTRRTFKYTYRRSSTPHNRFQTSLITTIQPQHAKRKCSSVTNSTSPK